MEDLQAQGARALVFDMRNNGGGYLTQLTEMLDFLLPEGPIPAPSPLRPRILPPPG